MVGIWTAAVLIGGFLQGVMAVPVVERAPAAVTVGKIRGVRDPIYHLYLQASPKNRT